MTSRFFLAPILVLFCLGGGALAQTPDSSNMSQDRARSRSLSLQEAEQSRSLFEQAFAQLQAGNLQDARIVFERGLKIDPANVIANFYLAETLLRMGDKAGARRFYERVIAIDANSAEAVKAQTALKDLPAMAEPNAASADAANRLVLVSGVNERVKTVAELIAAMKAHPGAYVIGCAPGMEATSCVAAERLKTSARLAFDRVPYRREASVIDDVSAGQVQFAFLPMTAVLQPISEGKLRALAVTGPTRSPNLAQVPTLAESGVSGL
jgi:tetratricopeptide (TPR) repeat protein